MVMYVRDVVGRLRNAYRGTLARLWGSSVEHRLALGPSVSPVGMAVAGRDRGSCQNRPVNAPPQFRPFRPDLPAHRLPQASSGRRPSSWLVVLLALVIATVSACGSPAPVSPPAGSSTATPGGSATPAGSPNPSDAAIYTQIEQQAAQFLD